uniref:Transcription initiation factor TFIID subunit 8 n=1 Tax=Kalanchoe fedtschenkoi TaxID=63787 RepID=A0A7N0VAX1_KALFE
MSHGENSGDRVWTQSRRAEPDDYARTVSRVSAAQICEGVGFQSCQDSALDALAEVVVRYVRDLGRVAASHANLAGRTDCNVFDVVRGLEDLGLGRGFSGGSSVSHCLSGSGVVKDLVEYVGSNEDVPFALPLPWFPVVVERSKVPSFAEMEEKPAGKHIPDWLPAFPDPHTYVHTPMWNERKSDPRQDKVEQVRQRRKAERALLGLQQRLNISGSAGLSSAVSDLVESKEVKMNGSSSSLVKPLQLGWKNVSLIESADNSSDEAVRDKNPVTVLEAFAPAIEAAKSGICELGDGEHKGLSDKRPLVFLKFGSGRKLLGRPSILSLHSQSHKRRRTSLLGRDDERDDKKRRAELILRHSMENPQELTQL